MAVTLNASTSSGLVQTADTSGTVEIQSNGTTKLTVSSSGVNIGQMNGGAITSGTAVASTSGTAIDFTSLPSWVKRITVMFNGVSTNGTSVPIIQIGDSGGFETSGYTGSVANNGASATNFSTGFALVGSSTLAALAQSGHIVITNISGNIWIASINLGRTDSAMVFNGAGNKTLSDVLDRVRITTVNGTDTFDAGSINILYEG
jgi:hypothetical protein